MSASTHNHPRYYGSLFNLEHRVMSGAVITLAVLVLVLFGQEGRAGPNGVTTTVEAPTADGTHGELDGWVRPAEIRVEAPSASLFVGDLNEWLLTPVRLVKPPQPALARTEAVDGVTQSGDATSTPAQPAAVHVDPPDVAELRLGESLSPSLMRPRVVSANGGIGH